jgi:hypothetical protein
LPGKLKQISAETSTSSLSTQSASCGHSPYHLERRSWADSRLTAFGTGNREKRTLRYGAEEAVVDPTQPFQGRAALGGLNRAQIGHTIGGIAAAVFSVIVTAFLALVDVARHLGFGQHIPPLILWLSVLRLFMAFSIGYLIGTSGRFHAWQNCSESRT